MFQRNERAPVTPGRSGQRFWSVLGLLYVLVELTRVRYFLVLQIIECNQFDNVFVHKFKYELSLPRLAQALP
jgi:hypothetical protein